MRSFYMLLVLLLKNWNDIITQILTMPYLFLFAGCGINFTSPAGRIVSPNYPSQYGDNLNCSYIIDRGPQSLVILEFETFHLEGNWFFVMYECTMKHNFLLENIQVLYHGKWLMVWFPFWKLFTDKYLQREFAWVQFCVSEGIQKNEDRAHMYILQHWSRGFARWLEYKRDCGQFVCLFLSFFFLPFILWSFLSLASCFAFQCFCLPNW